MLFHSSPWEVGFSSYAEDNEPTTPTDGPAPPTTYHGTRADLKAGDLIRPGFSSNNGQRRQATWVYFSATLDARASSTSTDLGRTPLEARPSSIQQVQFLQVQGLH